MAFEGLSGLFGLSLGQLSSSQLALQQALSIFEDEDTVNLSYERRLLEERQNRYPPFGGSITTSTSTKAPDIQFTELKKSVKSIKAEPFTVEARRRIEAKINRLQSAGATAQALILERELQTRDALLHLMEWDYKLLTKETIEKFQ